MRVELAKKAGFCFGVRRAVGAVYRELEKGGGGVWTYGPIIHNDSVIRELEKRGVRILGDEELIDEDKNLAGQTAIIRSHGVSREREDMIRASGMRIVDATCPFVKRIHRYAETYTEKGYFIVVAGDPSHPEVEGILGRAKRSMAAAVSSRDEAESLEWGDVPGICVLSQTTFNYNKFLELLEILREKSYHKSDTVESGMDFVVFDTVCKATKERQEAAAELAASVDAMLVIGGAGSSNTRKLYEICLNECSNTYFIQKAEDLEFCDLAHFGTVGITAGASTPNNIIEEVIGNVRSKL